MKRTLITAALIAAGSSAVAHPGHFAEMAGHSHWLEYAAIGAFIAFVCVSVALARRNAASARRVQRVERRHRPD